MAGEEMTAVFYTEHSGYYECEGGASATISFDRAAVIYEDPYTNMPGEVVHPASSNSVLRYTVYGGNYGALVSVALNDSGEECVVRLGGDMLPNNLWVEPGGEYSFATEYAPLKPSSRENDIVATLALSEILTGSSCSYDTCLTSIKLTTETEFKDIEFTHRKILGVGERVCISWTPSLYWPHLSDAVLSNGTMIYTAPSCAAREGIVFSNRDSVYEIAFDTFEPKEKFLLDKEGSGSCTYGSAGEIDAWLTLCILPTNVSFRALEFAEIGMASTNATGYFTNEHVRTWLDHSRAGANSWHSVNPGNVFYDNLVLPQVLPPWGDGGGFTWPIPNAWRMPGGVTNFLDHLPAYDQRFELDSDGTTWIIKMGCVFESTTNCEFRINGELQ